MLNQIIELIKLCGIIFYPLSFLFIFAIAIIFDKILLIKKMPKMQELVEKTSSLHLANFEIEISNQAKKIEKKLNSFLWFLETIITAAPLLGLLGTIIGMMSSFKLIGENDLVNPVGITAGVAEALIATAYGLIIAIFSLFAFNYFSQKKDEILDEIEHFSNKIFAEKNNEN
jgi:biopolymer transport protein ExbB